MFPLMRLSLRLSVLAVLLSVALQTSKAGSTTSISSSCPVDEAAATSAIDGTAAAAEPHVLSGVGQVFVIGGSQSGDRAASMRRQFDALGRGGPPVTFISGVNGRALRRRAAPEGELLFEEEEEADGGGVNRDDLILTSGGSLGSERVKLRVRLWDWTEQVGCSYPITETRDIS